MSSIHQLKRRNLYKEFLHQSTLHGLRLLLCQTPFKYARLLWKILIAVVIIWTQYVITNLIFEYMGQPTEVRMSTHRVHISETPFPAVSVCNGNRYSRKKLTLYAEEVFKQQQAFRPNYLAKTPEEMSQYILLLDGFYLMSYDERPLDRRILEKLDDIMTYMHNTTDYPVREIIRHLAPSCQDMIIRGIAYGMPIDPMKYWQARMTSMGLCCMFNYKRSSYAIDPDNAFLKDINSVPFESNSILNSAQFLLQSDIDDFIVDEFQADAFLVTLFPPRDFTTIQSSHIGSLLINYNTIVEIPVQPEFHESSNSVRQFKPQVRNCYFSEEGQKLLNTSYYSIDECLMKCRMLSMLKYCGCVTPPMVATYDNVTFCTFPDLICLRRWLGVWYGWEYFEYVNEADPEALNDLTAGSRCPHCLPTCNGVRFRIYKNEMTLRTVIKGYGAYSHGILKGLNNSRPLSIIKLFFKLRHAPSTTLDVVASWVVHLNRFGGIMGLMYGFSIISCIEIFYFTTGKFFCLYIKKWRGRSCRRISRVPKAVDVIQPNDESPPAYSLYWNELIVKPKIDVSQQYVMHKRL